jgi:hypothetical protein
MIVPNLSFVRKPDGCTKKKPAQGDQARAGEGEKPLKGQDRDDEAAPACAQIGRKQIAPLFWRVKLGGLLCDWPFDDYQKQLKSLIINQK